MNPSRPIRIDDDSDGSLDVVLGGGVNELFARFASTLFP
jgi:hypothetical protein